MQTVLIAIRNYADDDSGNVDIHSRLTVKPFKKMKGAGRLFLLKNVDRELVKHYSPPIIAFFFLLSFFI